MTSTRLSVFAVFAFIFMVVMVQAAPSGEVSVVQLEGARVDSSFLSTQKDRRESDDGDDTDVQRIDLVFLSKLNNPREEAVENVFLF
ncbi:hypothetical protein C8Q79DRAFT_1012643 [Trametes meyenii]|nr:hypothetical protein C8Q79DRAFT_1012643 [Trametes meyenii]